MTPADVMMAGINYLLGGISGMMSEEVDCLSLDFCLRAAKEAGGLNQQIKFFVIALNGSNTEKFEILMAFLDGQKKAVTYDGETTEGYLFSSKYIDKKLFDALKGNKPVIVQM